MTPQPLASPMISMIRQVGKEYNLYKELFLAEQPLNPNIVDVMRVYFETYGDPNDFSRIAMISLSNHSSFIIHHSSSIIQSSIILEYVKGIESFIMNEKQILDRLSVIQVKAGKCDVLFKMLDSFNQNSIHVTVTWDLIHKPGRYLLTEIL